MNYQRLLTSILLIFISALITAPEARSEILKYTDNQGNSYYVDSADKVPKAYKEQIGNGKKLPSISRVQGREYEKITPSASANNVKSEKVEVFVTSWCPHCKELEAFLTANRIQFAKYDIEKDPAGKSKYDKIGVKGVPVTKIGTNIIAGFDRARLGELLGR